MKRKKRASPSSKKNKKMTPAELRTNLIIAGVIFGVSIALFLGKAALFPGADSRQSTKVPAQPAVSVERPAETPESPVVVDLPPEEPSEPEVQPEAVAETSAPAQNELAQNAPAQNVPAKDTSSQSTPNQRSPDRVTQQPTRPATTVPVKPSKPIKPRAQAIKPQVPAVAARQVASKPVKPVPEKKRGTLIFVFDDAGYNLNQLQPFLELPFPCTIAVLPGLQYSKEAARRIRSAGKDAILHQPMQAINLSKDPGPGAIKQGMKPDEIRAIVRKNLAEVWPVSGLNNHEGSYITADRQSMEAVLDVVREKGIRFLDSRTNAKTQAPSIARERGMTIWERAVFLDNSQDKAAIIEAINNGMKIADKKGSAIMIGHIWSNQLAGILHEMYPELVSQGYSLSTLAKLATNEEFDE